MLFWCLQIIYHNTIQITFFSTLRSNILFRHYSSPLLQVSLGEQAAQRRGGVAWVHKHRGFSMESSKTLLSPRLFTRISWMIPLLLQDLSLWSFCTKSVCHLWFRGREVWEMYNNQTSRGTVICCPVRLGAGSCAANMSWKPWLYVCNKESAFLCKRWKETQ